MKLYPTPKQAMRVPIAKPSISALEREYVHDAFEKQEFSGVPSLEYIQRFENAWMDRVGRDYCISVNSGTDAIESVLRALGIGYGDEVLIPAWTFAAPANACLYVGATPVLVDIDPENWTIDPDQVIRYRMIQNRTQQYKDPVALIGVDIFGHPCDWSLLKRSTREIQFGIIHPDSPEVILIEDAAQAHGAHYVDETYWGAKWESGSEPCGSFGVASTFSMFANKAITSGEGGVILTDDHELAERISLIRNHGMKANYEHELVGGNHRLNNLSAALGAAQMERWDYLIAERERVARTYDTHLPEELGRRPVSSWAQPATWLVVVTHPERDRLVAGLRAQGIDARPTWKSLDQFPIYAAGVRGEYPVANKVAAETFVLPTYPDLDDQTIIEICRMLENLLR